tara:strand:+ start:331 stop:954 length:624 start_codon:yes stop_codon:yes gene_type:complete
MSQEKEHPDWNPPQDFDFDKLKTEGFEDMSWHNDAYPFFGDYKRGYTLGVDYVEDKSDFQGEDNFVRYHLFKRELAEGEKEHECLHDDAEHVLSTDCFHEVMAVLQGTDQERRVKELCKGKDAEQLISEMEELAEEALQKAFLHIQYHLHAQSGDQACYYWDNNPKLEKFTAMMARYAVSELALVLDEDDKACQPLAYYAYAGGGES